MLTGNNTVISALEMGTPVLLIDPAAPQEWSILTRPEELGHPERNNAPDAVRQARLEATIRAAMVAQGWHPQGPRREQWRDQSSRAFSLYRLIEQVFGDGTLIPGRMRIEYESPDAISTGSAAGVLAAAEAAPGADPLLVARLRGVFLPMFARADGIASRLSDAYRSGMCVNFVLAALAVIIGLAFYPFGLAKVKWVFASAELLLLAGILVITLAGSRLGWHRRWFEMRRVAEYLRHAPGLLLVGVSRPTGRWPRKGGRGHEAEWPEHFARHALREAGLPRIRVTRAYLRACLEGVVRRHVSAQGAYHEVKAARLERVHHRLDRLAGASFLLAVISVLAYLLLKFAALAGVAPTAWADDLSPLFTFLGVAFPTLGANIAGVRYFGDFERFGAISRAAAERLGEVETRIDLLLSGTETALSYEAVAELLHAVDDAVVGEIESWQAVFGAKHLALPA